MFPVLAGGFFTTSAPGKDNKCPGSNQETEGGDQENILNRVIGEAEEELENWIMWT